MTDATPTANLGHGPGGLFSNPALEGTRRKSKSAQRRAEKARQAYKAVQIDPEAHPGAMIALMLSPEQQAAVTEGIPGTLAQEADHCTLIYLADDASTIAGSKAALLSYLGSIAGMTQPIEVTLNGYGAFAGDEKQYPLVLLLNSPQLPWLRHSLYLHSEASGISLEDKHGFTPHITLAYLPADRPMPRLERKNIPLRFESISLIWAGERIDLPLLGIEPDQSQYAGYTMEDWSDKAKMTAKAPVRASAAFQSDKPPRATARTPEALKTAPSASESVTTKPFRSRSQWKWAWATGQNFARRWAHETPGGKGERFRRLPSKVRRKSKSAQARLALKANYGARAGGVIAGNLVRGNDGKFTSAGKPAAPKKPAKGKQPKKTPEQRAAEAEARAAQRDQERNDTRRANEAAVGEQAGLGTNLSDALLEFASPDEAIELAPQNAKALLDKGLVEQNADGSYRISGAGRSYVAAARAGDVSRARDALGRAGTQSARRQAVAERRAAAEAKRQGKDPKAEKPKKGGGGGGKKDEKPAKGTTDNLRAIGPKGDSSPAKASGGGSGGGKQPSKAAPAKPSKAETAGATAQRVGLESGDYDALRSAAEGGISLDGPDHRLVERGLIDYPSGEATDQGRRALSALERGDVRAYQAALQDAQARIKRERTAAAKREDTAQKVKGTHGYWKTYRKARADGLMPLEARKVAKEQVLNAKLDRNHRQRSALAAAMIGIR